MKRAFLLKLLPPRADFMTTMTDGERALMAQHAAHWMKAFEAGDVIAFGPVVDSNGGFGVGIASVDDEAALDTFQRTDPVIAAGVGFRYERFPMPRLIARTN